MKNSLEVLNEELSLSPQARFLKKYGMYSAALYYKNMNECIVRRGARASRYCFEQMPLPAYREGQRLFAANPNGINQKPAGDDENNCGFTVNASGDCVFDKTAFSKLRESCQNSVETWIVESILHDCEAMYMSPSRCRYDHGGMHNIPDISYVLAHGIEGYRTEVLKRLKNAEDISVRQFEEGMLDLIEGIEIYLSRYAAMLSELAENYPGDKKRLLRLAEAVKKVPMQPAENFYEAFISCDAVMFLSDCFEPGRFDHYLLPFYEKDLAAGNITPEELLSLTDELLGDLDSRIGHPGVVHLTIGGSNADGSPCYNAITLAVLTAIQGRRTPNVSLRVRQDMPQEFWDAALYNISKGYSHPALINEELFLSCLTKDYHIPYEDAVNYVFGGCSELLIAGMTSCDSTWVAFNALEVFEHTLYNHLLECDSFADFYAHFRDEMTFAVRDMTEQINIRQETMGLHQSWVLRTLFARDCIQNAKSYAAGGTRYSFDSTNYYSCTNAVNALFAIREFYAGKLGDLTKEELLKALITNYEGREDIHKMLLNLPKFGNYNPELQQLAHEVLDLIFTETMRHTCWRGNASFAGRFMPCVVLWVTWIRCGERLGATPDGRVLGEATADSCGPMQGTDSEGPTSVMGAALSLPQNKCAGTCVLNLRLDAANFRNAEGFFKVQKLFEAYFLQGGSQLQINVVDPQQLREAMKDPEKHKDIIVRVGGFSDNFVLLSDKIQKEILRRTEHSL